MTGRPRGRPPGKRQQSNEPTTPAGRRSTRHQQQQIVPPPESLPEDQPNEDQDQEQSQVQDQAQVQDQGQDQNQDQDQHQNQNQEPEPEPEAEPEPEPGAEPEPEPETPHKTIEIDPAITGGAQAQAHGDDDMPPPPVPGPRSLRSQGKEAELGPTEATSRRAAVRDPRAKSLVSYVSDSPAYSPTPQQSDLTDTTPKSTPAPFLAGTPSLAMSLVSSERDETPGRRNTRAKLMARFLVRLFAASDDLFSHLAAPDPAVVDSDETWQDLHLIFKNAFETYRRSYVADISHPLIDPAYVLASLGTEKGSPRWFEVSRIIAAANLATLLDDIWSIKELDPLVFLQGLDAVFPSFFVSNEPAFCSAVSAEDIAAQVVEIRTHLSFLTLQKQMEGMVVFDPHELIVRIFCDESVSLDEVKACLASHDDPMPPLFRSVAGIDINGNRVSREHFLSRLRSVFTFVKEDPTRGFILRVDDIEQTYQFHSALENLKAFVVKSFHATKSLMQTSSQPGPHFFTSQSQSAASDSGSRIENQIQSQLESEAMVAHPPGASGGAQMTWDASSLRALKAMHQQGPDNGGRLSSQDIIAGTQDYQPNPYLPVGPAPYPPNLEAPRHHGMAYGEPHQSVFHANGSMFAESAAQLAGRKRPAPDDGSESIEPPRPAKKTRVRKKKAIIPVVTPADPALGDGRSETAGEGGSQYPELPNAQMEPDFEAVAQRSKELSAASRKAREPQVRSAWVRHDVRLLVKAVDTFKCKWSQIETQIKAGLIPFERPRDQQALRDKARLLKQDFLKADAVLPPSFDLVVLGRKERAAVEACGKNPDRKEADILDGRVVNTEFVPKEPGQELEQ
ncbi:hypothetical protein B0T22DRAFT_109073 [Podospora appendiculata]|uniref:Myb-like domain-containing protein n=1 Tax=Podospora appendiculata TaxID=314037 RepID=A0AAE1CIE2_9PEZI|nr:hypothetical protein B0T22DRAFT_109073 [Podospora appendiculata]